MSKLSSYSKYQKEIIKRLSTELGISIPFTYEKTSKNHLKVLIEGVNKPYYTSSTPSDMNSGINFMSDVKRALKAKKIDVAPVLNTYSVNNNKAKKLVFCEKLTEQCIKSLRSRLPTLTLKETALVKEEQSVDVIKGHRLLVIKSTIDFILKSKRFAKYITTKEINTIIDKVTKHINFMLPSNAHYAELIKVNAKGKATKNNLSAIHVLEQKDYVEETRQAKPEKTEINKEMKAIAIVTDKTAFQMGWLTKQSNGKQIKTLQELSSAEALRMIENINQAMQLNRQKAIHDVFNLMQSSGVSLDDLNESLQSAA